MHGVKILGGVLFFSFGGGLQGTSSLHRFMTPCVSCKTHLYIVKRVALLRSTTPWASLDTALDFVMKFLYISFETSVDMCKA